MTETSRREFLGAAAAAAIVSTGPGVRRAAAQAKTGANDAITLGLIGCGARGSVVMKYFMGLPGVRFAAVCDVHSGRLAAGRDAAGGEPVQAYPDFRRVIDRKDIDAVVVATQAHWHALPIIAACQAGKDVYCEKPLGNSIGEGRYAIQAARKYNRIVQIGTQQRSLPHYRKAAEIVRSGELGEISEVEVWDCENWSPGRGFPEDCDPPKELDWEFYVGPAPARRYNPNCFYSYGYDWFRFSGAGHQVAWGVHHFDIVNWAMGADWPVAVSAAGGNFAFQDNREWPNTFTALAEYGPCPAASKGFVLQYTMRVGCRRDTRSHGKCFYGTKASMVLDRHGYTIVPEGRKTQPELKEGPWIAPEQHTYATGEEALHCQDFLDSMRTRRLPAADVEHGHHSSNVGHLMNIAWEVGRRIRWDGRKEQVIDDPQANELVTKRYRAPWKLEV